MADPIAALEARRTSILQLIAGLGDMRPGSLSCRTRPCGKPECHCPACGRGGCPRDAALGLDGSSPAVLCKTGSAGALVSCADVSALLAAVR